MNVIIGSGIRIIGRVKNNIEGKPAQGWSETVSEIEIDNSLLEALEGLEDFSHLIILFWMDRIPPTEELLLKVHPMRKAELPEVGLFATRTPNRPNRIGMTTVELIERRRNYLKVKGLDAFHGTPVIDIKPYLPGDTPLEVRTPAWLTGR